MPTIPCKDIEDSTTMCYPADGVIRRWFARHKGLLSVYHRATLHDAPSTDSLDTPWVARDTQQPSTTQRDTASGPA